MQTFLHTCTCCSTDNCSVTSHASSGTQTSGISVTEFVMSWRWLQLLIWGWEGVAFDAERRLLDSLHAICLTGHSKKELAIFGGYRYSVSSPPPFVQMLRIQAHRWLRAGDWPRWLVLPRPILQPRCPSHQRTNPWDHRGPSHRAWWLHPVSTHHCTHPEPQHHSHPATLPGAHCHPWYPDWNHQLS